MQTLALCELLAEITGEAAELLCSPDGARRASGDSGRSIHAAIDFHAFGQLVLGAWAHTNQATRDAPRLDLIGQEMARAMHPQVPQGALHAQPPVLSQPLPFSSPVKSACP